MINSSNPIFEQKPEACPSCGYSPVGNILFGLPAFDEGLKAELESGATVLGGCCISGDDPAWECSKCGWQGWKSDRVEVN